MAYSTLPPRNKAGRFAIQAIVLRRNSLIGRASEADQHSPTHTRRSVGIAVAFSMPIVTTVLQEVKHVPNAISLIIRRRYANLDYSGRTNQLTRDLWSIIKAQGISKQALGTYPKQMTKPIEMAQEVPIKSTVLTMQITCGLKGLKNTI